MGSGELYFGKFSPIFEDHFLSKISSAISFGSLSPQYVLVGSNLLALHLRHALALRTGGHTNLHFLTFVDLAQKILDASQDSPPPPLFPPNVEELLIEDLLQNLSSEHPFYALKEQPGLHLAIKSTFHDLLDGNIDTLPPHPSFDFLRDLYSKHREAYAHQFSTQADRILRATEIHQDFSHILGSPQLWIYGFYDLTKLQQNLLTRCARSMKLRFWVPTFDDNSFRSSWSLMNSLAEKVENIVNHPPPEPQVTSFPHQIRETEETVRTILSLLETESTPLHRIAILLRQPTIQMEEMGEILRRANIPFYREGGSPFNQTRLGKSLLILTQHLHSDWSRTAILEFLSTFPFHPEKTQNMGQPTDWDFWSRSANCLKGFENFRFRIEQWATTTQQQNFVQFISDLFSHLESIEKETTSWKSLAISLSETIENFANPQEDWTSIRKLIVHLEQLAFYQLPTSNERTRRVLKAQLNQLRIPNVEAFQRKGLFLGSVSSARMITFDHVFIPGMVSKQFPAPFREDPLLLDPERAWLNQNTSGLLTLRGSRNEEERALFQLAKGCASRSLHLSFARMEATTSRPLVPSSFLPEKKIETKPLLKWRDQISNVWIDEDDWLSGKVGREVCRSQENALKKYNLWSPLAKNISTWVNHRFGQNSWTSFDGIIQPSSVQNLSPKHHSVSSLREYVVCPYRFFLRKIIKLSPIERPDQVEEMKPLDRGTLIHEILQKVFEFAFNEGLFPLKPNEFGRILVALEVIANQAFQRAEQELPLGHHLLWKTQRDYLLADLRALLKQELDLQDDYIPSEFEVGFDDVKLSTGEITLAMRGRIDRIDTTKDGKRARIIDYKTGKVPTRGDTFEGGRSLQLPLYVQILSSLRPSIDLSDWEGILLSTSYGSGFRRTQFTGNDLVLHRETLFHILNTISNAMQSSLFPPLPGKQEADCQSCDFRLVCGKSIHHLSERKQGDERTLNLIELGEIK